MKNSFEVAKRFKEVILNGTWIANTNFRHQLTGLSWRTATRQVHNLNSIAVLAQHIHYYVRGVLQVLEGGKLDIRDKFSFDFPPIVSQEQWEAFLAVFWRDSEKFAERIEEMSDEQLDEAFVDEKYGTYERNLEGMIEHCYYHLGQVVLIRKILTPAEFIATGKL